MAKSRLQKLAERGQSIWIDNLSRQLVQLARTCGLQLEVESEVILQPKHGRLRGTEQTHLGGLTSLLLSPLLRCASR